MNDLTTEERVKNIFVFLSIIFGEDLNLSEKILEMSPEYLIEKFNRYILSSKAESDWGINPSLRLKIFDKYCRRYKLKITSYNDEV